MKKFLGIFLWELFTLGKTPYGELPGKEIFEKLISGYRLEKPEFADEKIYEIMLSCWKLNPETRPLFKELELTLKAFLLDDTEDVSLDNLTSNSRNFTLILPALP